MTAPPSPTAELRAETLAGRPGQSDAVHERLKLAIEQPQSAYLWTPSDAIKFTPYLSPTVYGDGRALFTVATINQRPAYWVIRACSTWGCGSDCGESEGPDFAEMTDEIMTDLEQAFGSGRCGYSGSSLFWPREERIGNCQCEECDDEIVESWPTVDGYGGCSWSRMNWPEGFEAVPNPLSWRGSLLVLPLNGLRAGQEVG